MDIDNEQDDDPVIAEYNIFMTPQLKDQLLLLQYHNRHRDQAYNAENRALPSELRIKSETGFLEVDIGVSTTQNFDKIKGLQWGQALKHAKDSKAKGFGISSGFGKGNEEGGLKVMVGEKKEDGDVERMLGEFESRLEGGRVLTKQTLGGQVRRPAKDRPFDVVGTFRGDELHLTTLHGTVHMRPQFHHLDAQAAITKHTLSRSQKTPAKAPQPMTAAVIQAQRNKQVIDDNQLPSTYEATNKFLEQASDENWKRLWFRDENEEEAFKEFEETMVLKDVVEAKELKSGWGNVQYLDKIRDGTDVVEVPKAVAKKPTKKVAKGKAPAVSSPSRRRGANLGPRDIIA